MALFAQKNLKTFDVSIIKITKSSFDSKASELRRGNAKCYAAILYIYMIKVFDVYELISFHLHFAELSTNR